MVIISRLRSSVSIGFLVVLAAFITSCNPAIYKKPAENFHTATVALKDAYFLGWDVSNKARIERGDLEDQIALWVAPIHVGESEIERVIQRMTERRMMDIHEALKPLREKAFAVLEGYAGVLVSLSSDEPTEAIVAEVNGLVRSVEATLESVGRMKIAADKSEVFKSFAGPLQQYVGVLNEIVQLVSSAVRYNAIVQTIGKSNDSVLELLAVLKSEAVAARNNAHSQVIKARELLDGLVVNSRFVNADNAFKAAVAKRISVLNAIAEQMKKDDIDKAFDAAVKAQGALVKKALLKDPGDWTVQIQAFKERVAATKEAIEKIDSDM